MSTIATDRTKYHEPVQGTVFHGDGREEALQKALQQDPALQNNPSSQDVLNFLYEFGKKFYLMNVGGTKGEGVENIIKERKPKLILEIGAYVGYSGICFSRHMKAAHPDSKYPADWTADSTEDRAGYISLEKSPVYAATARTALQTAGLGDVVRIIEGGSTSSIRTLRETLNLPSPLTFDMVFIDHLKPMYTNDLKMLEDEGLVGPGTCIVADNVVKPGNPAYLSWVRATPAAKRASLAKPRFTSQPPTTTNPETKEEWTKAFFDGPIDETRWTPDECEGISATGNPGFVYSSEMVWGYDDLTAEVDACEISVCLREEKE